MKLSHINTGLLAAIIVVNVITILLPLVPALAFWAGGRLSNAEDVLSQQLHIPVAELPAHSSEHQTQANRLVVPAMHLDEQIHEGRTARTLQHGLWRRPHTSTPDQGSNTVISAHRFTYTNPEGSFYHLDKLQPGDEIGVFWHNKRYLYKVTEAKVTDPYETIIEDSTAEPVLTLYTCTPLWLPKDRLVVVASLVKTEVIHE